MFINDPLFGNKKKLATPKNRCRERKRSTYICLGKSPQKLRIDWSFDTLVFKLFNHCSQSHLPVGDEFAPFSAARRSARPGTSAFTAPRSFGCDRAALYDDSHQDICRTGPEIWPD
jgi:hypothetical protein